MALELNTFGLNDWGLFLDLVCILIGLRMLIKTGKESRSNSDIVYMLALFFVVAGDIVTRVMFCNTPYSSSNANTRHMVDGVFAMLYFLLVLYIPLRQLFTGLRQKEKSDQSC